MSKISITGLEARKKAIKGMSYVAEAIKSTIGPFGQNFILEKDNKSTNDGYNISTELAPTIKDEFERRGALFALKPVSEVNEIAGDATSTTWALEVEITKEAERYLPNEKSIKAKKSSAEIIKEIKESTEQVIKELETMAEPIKDKETLIKSALVSVEDTEIAELLGSMQWELGKNGRIIAEEVNESKSSIERVNGIRLDNGFGTALIENNPEKHSFEIDNFPIFLTNYTIGKDEIAILQKNIFNQMIMQKMPGLILVARAYTPDAIKTLMESIKSGFAIFPINAPYVDQTQVLHDIEAVVGGRYIDTEENSLEDTYITDVGFVKRFEARRYDAYVTGIDDDQAKQRITKRTDELKKKLLNEGSNFQKRNYEERISQLEGGFAILKVGSISESTRKRLKDKCDDAVNAVRLALQGGTVKGGGLAFKEISDKMEENILKRPLLCIYNQIMSSAPEGFIIEDWVRDPYLVLKCALEHASKTASDFAITGGIITSENPKQCYCGTKKDDL